VAEIYDQINDTTKDKFKKIKIYWVFYWTIFGTLSIPIEVAKRTITKETVLVEFWSFWEHI
jgi:hypothetical protein